MTNNSMTYDEVASLINGLQKPIINDLEKSIKNEINQLRAGLVSTKHQLLSVKEVSEILNIKEGTIRNYLSQGTFPIPRAKTPGRKVLFLSRDLENYLESLEN